MNRFRESRTDDHTKPKRRRSHQGTGHGSRFVSEASRGQKASISHIATGRFPLDLPRPSRVLDCARTALSAARCSTTNLDLINEVTLLRLHDSAAAHACLLGRRSRPRELTENKSHRSNHVAIAHRYACCCYTPRRDALLSRQARAPSLRTTVER